MPKKKRSAEDLVAGLRGNRGRMPTKGSEYMRKKREEEKEERRRAKKLGKFE